MPAEAEYDSIKCSAFIDGQLSKTPPTSKQVRASATCPCVMPLPNRSISPVSPISAACTQIEYARVLATRAGVEIPLDVQQSSASISKFIEQYADRSGQLGGPVSSVPVGTMPSEKQLLFAARLARERGLGLSLEARLPPLPPPAASSRCLPLPLPDPRPARFSSWPSRRRCCLTSVSAPASLTTYSINLSRRATHRPTPRALAWQAKPETDPHPVPRPTSKPRFQAPQPLPHSHISPALPEVCPPGAPFGDRACDPLAWSRVRRRVCGGCRC